MGDTLDYTEEEAQQEEATFETAAATDRRQLVREKLTLQPNKDVLSIGCGPGFEPAELARVVGQHGSVPGIDQSEAMLALARRRCSDIPNIILLKADAIDLPITDNSMDAAVAVQVYEYIEHLERALMELHRILRLGARAVIYDTDFDSLVWHSTDPE